MVRGKLLVIEGTDCSGKETQTRMLVERLTREGIPIGSMSFPRYDTPTGRIIGGPYLGKEGMGESYFTDPASEDPKIISPLYAIDRRAATPEIEAILQGGGHLALDRFTDANAGHQGGKIRDLQERLAFYEWLYHLEHEVLEIPKPDLTVFLYMPYKVGMELREGRGGTDAHEADPGHLRNAEEAYLQLAELNSWTTIHCVPDGTSNSLRTPEDIAEEVYGIVTPLLLGKGQTALDS